MESRDIRTALQRWCLLRVRLVRGEEMLCERGEETKWNRTQQEFDWPKDGWMLACTELIGEIIIGNQR